IGGIGGGDGGLLSPITGIIGGIGGIGGDGSPLDLITGIIGGIGGIGGDGSPLDLITGIIGGIGGGDGGSPLDILTGIIGGIGGGDLGNNPITGVIQTGIDILQGVESLKTDLINTGINTVADAIIGVFPQAEHPVSDLANLGTLTFETSRDTVNGTLEAISDLAGANFGGALGNATGVIGTLINNGSTAAGIIQHVIGEDILGGGIIGGIGGGDGGLLSPITGIIGGIGGIGGDGSPLDLITG
ncbi:agmatine deiminase, partial [Acinetobacter haemolyticus]|nr:agmatine deiminase [Acinetobacter haemolyticus]